MHMAWIRVNIVKQIHTPQNINREGLIVQNSDSKGRGKLFSLKSYHRWSGVRGGCHTVVRASVTASGAPNSPSHQGEGGVGPRGEHHSGHGRFQSTGARQCWRSGTGWGRDLGHWRGGLVGLWQVQQQNNPTSMPTSFPLLLWNTSNNFSKEEARLILHSSMFAGFNFKAHQISFICIIIKLVWNQTTVWL